MSTSPLPADDADAVAGARMLSRGISATWWYTVTGALFLEAVVVLMWFGFLVENDVRPGGIAIVTLGGLAWLGATALLLLQYRRRDDTVGPASRWRVIAFPLLVAVVYGVFAGVTTGLWIVGVLPFAQALMLLNWPRGVRVRLVLITTVVLGALWFVDQRTAVAPSGGAYDERNWWMFGFFSVALPALTVLSLWWWDVLATLDKARLAEARLGATQERLRIATDVHDLQGHHLQVIALQLELAERLMAKDPDAALEQLRLARESVDAACQGTRDLATRFRSVPLRDELANAVDLLRAAGTVAEATVEAEADRAPASVLGPVIRETTTNVLRHGGGRWARLSLTRTGALWRYEIANDPASDSVDSTDGSGLEGIARRAAEAGGSVEVERGRQEFTVVVTIPEGER